MYSCVFLVWIHPFSRVFWLLYCVTPVTLFKIRRKDSTEKTAGGPAGPCLLKGLEGG